MWAVFAICSALLLGLHDVAKKQALRNNGVLYILLCATGLTTAFLSPFLTGGPLRDHLFLIFKAVLVTTSWVAGLKAMEILPITTAATMKASRPVFVLLLSIIIYGERLNWIHWTGVAAVFTALYLLSRSSASEGIDFKRNKGVLLMGVSILSGVASALLDKYISQFIEPLFLQSWCNLYITVILAMIVVFKRLSGKGGTMPFKWDWMLLVIAVLITGADFLYFQSLNKDGAMLSVISLIRRCSVVVTFTCGAVIFKERMTGAKVFDMCLMLAGTLLLVVGSL